MPLPAIAPLQDITMNTDEKRPEGGINASDQDKANTPDKHRNDNARWKDHDMPDAKHNARPEDYERVPPAKAPDD